jgi:hypothetical protein
MNSSRVEEELARLLIIRSVHIMLNSGVSSP